MEYCLIYSQNHIQSVTPDLKKKIVLKSSSCFRKMVMDKVSKTGLVTFLDDGRMTATLAEFLLQLQGGLMQGSSTQGALVPRGSVLLSSNYVEPERYI